MGILREIEFFLCPRFLAKSFRAIGIGQGISHTLVSGLHIGLHNSAIPAGLSQNVLAEHKLDTYCGYNIASHTTQQHTTQDEPMLTLPPPALPSLSMETSSMDLNRGVAAPYEPNKGARRPGSRALRVFPLFGASKWRPSKI